MTTNTVIASNPGQDLLGYTLIRPLAEGGMAEVFAATQHSLGREVAVKVMKNGDASLAERFQREARLVATLNHSHIVHIYDVGTLPDGRPYLSMELLPGGDLRQRIRDGLSQAETLRILRQLAEGLQCVHEHGIVHRDIKPANILFRANGDAVLSDFGIAKATDVDTELTQAGTVVGSPAYSSPEQISTKSLDGRSDLYSLGVVLVEMLTGRNPFRGSDYAATVVNQLQMSPPRLPAGLQAWQPVVDRLLTKTPERRFADAAALLAALSTVAGAQKAVVPGDPDRTRVAPADEATLIGLDVPLRLDRFSPRQRLIGAVLALVLVSAGLAGWWFGRDPQIVEWLAQAEARLERDQLSSPRGDNAVFYYQLVLERDAENGSARRGLARVGERYAELARTARENGNLDQARDYVDLGLDVRPEDAELLGLREEIRAARRARKNGVQKFFDSLTGG